MRTSIVLAALFSIAIGGLAWAAQQAAAEADPAFAEVVDDPALPRVLLIGDSISIGYTPDVRERLRGKANVHRIPANGGPTTRGLAEIDAWLGQGKWDVIHFNWGLHDLKYVGGDPGSPNGRQQVPPDQYAKNLRALVERLQQTGARLIWCTTTPVPQGAAARVPGDDVKYNAIAAEIAAEHQLTVNDLHALAEPQLGKIQKRANVHFTPQGSAVLGAQVADKILAALKK